MIIADLEVFAKDWLIYWLDTNTREGYYIVNDREKLLEFYNKYKDSIMIFYNGSHYDQYVLQGILAGFNPKEVSDWIIQDGKPGWKFSELLREFPIVIFDVMQPNKSLKQCQASLGIEIVESSIPFDIGRKLTNGEILETLKYCKHDVMSTFEVFLQDGFYLSPQSEFQSSLDIIQEFNFPKYYMGRTKSQMGCAVLGAFGKADVDKMKEEEFDIETPDNVILGKYQYIKEWFENPKNHWYNKPREGYVTPKRNRLETEIAGIPHILAWGGIHGSVEREIVDGDLLLLDFSSLYPNIMVQYNLISRGVPNANRYVELLETRMRLRDAGNDRQESYKIALNGSYGQMKFMSSPLYDPKMANSVCVHGQLIAVDLIEKLEKHGDIINSNTDGVLVRVHNKQDRDRVFEIAEEVGKRVRINIDVDEYSRWIIKDVNNFIAITKDGKIEAKGGWTKFQNPLEYNYNIINKAIRNYFVDNISVEQTIMECNDLREFQIIANAGGKYEYAMYGDRPLMEKVNRVFASTNPRDKGIFKLHRETRAKEKIEMTPENCFIINDDIRDLEIPNRLDKNWYIDLANRRVGEFVK